MKTRLGLIALDQGCTTQFDGGTNFFINKTSRDKIDMFYTFNGCFYQIKKAEFMKFRVLRAKLKASTGHIWPAGRMLCMPAIDEQS